MSGSDRPEKARIAIKLGASSSSASKNSRGPLSSTSSTLGKRPRPSGLGDDSDSDSDDESREHGRHQRITAFGDHGAELERDAQDENKKRDGAKRRAPLVIERQANRDWRFEARARKGGRRQTAPPGMQQEDDQAEDAAKPVKWGLTITKTGAADVTESTMQDAAKEADAPDDPSDPEREAVDALMGKTTAERTKTTRVIQGVKNAEDDVFSKDFHDAPDVSTLDEYEAMPVEEFGAALLRGMGWDGKDRGPKVKQVVRRPNQMGLGAKELKGAEDLGAWNGKTGNTGSSRRNRPPTLSDYRREEEKRKAKREERSERSERHRDSERSERDRERDRDRHRDRDHHRDGDRHRSRR